MPTPAVFTSDDLRQYARDAAADLSGAPATRLWFLSRRPTAPARAINAANLATTFRRLGYGFVEHRGPHYAALLEFASSLSIRNLARLEDLTPPDSEGRRSGRTTKVEVLLSASKAAKPPDHLTLRAVDGWELMILPDLVAILGHDAFGLISYRDLSVVQGSARVGGKETAVITLSSTTGFHASLLTLDTGAAERFVALVDGHGAAAAERDDLLLFCCLAEMIAPHGWLSPRDLRLFIPPARSASASPLAPAPPIAAWHELVI